MRAGRDHYQLLDALRGVAALAVVCGHLGDAWSHPAGQDYVLAVDFFFILSGFVIAHAYGDRLKQSLSMVGFWRARAVRLYPLLILGAGMGGIVLLLLNLGDAGYDLTKVATATLVAALALPGYFLPTQLAFPVNAPAWSLFFELIASFVYAAVAAVLTRNRLIVLLAVAALLLMLDTLHRGTIVSGWSKDELYGGLLRVFFGFTCGLVLYEVRPQWTLMPRWGWALMLVLAALLFSPITHMARGQLVIAILIMPAIVWIASAVENGGALGRVGGFLGALSYPIYILHYPVLETTTAWLRPLAASTPWGFLAILQVCVFVAVAWLALRLFDEPFRAWLGRRFRNGRSTVGGANKPHAPST